jgi:hypothetical protein
MTGDKCVTTFMAVPEGSNPVVYLHVVEFEAVSLAGGTLLEREVALVRRHGVRDNPVSHIFTRTECSGEARRAR